MGHGAWGRERLGEGARERWGDWADWAQEEEVRRGQRGGLWIVYREEVRR